MSPFANQPELWLTGHIQRLHQSDKIIKIQAAARGFLTRSRVEKNKNRLVEVVVQPAEPPSVVSMLRSLGLHFWADNLPTAEEALADPVADELRRNTLWNAKIPLRFAGNTRIISEIEMADYHEHRRALSARGPPAAEATFPPQVEQTSFQDESLWSRLRKFISA